MVRNFNGNDYQIYAKRFIPKVSTVHVHTSVDINLNCIIHSYIQGEELKHTYKSLKWRKVFVEDKYLNSLGLSEPQEGI